MKFKKTGHFLPIDNKIDVRTDLRIIFVLKYIKTVLMGFFVSFCPKILLYLNSFVQTFDIALMYLYICKLL